MMRSFLLALFVLVGLGIIVARYVIIHWPIWGHCRDPFMCASTSPLPQPEHQNSGLRRLYPILIAQ
jgi:hypothetical protein